MGPAMVPLDRALLSSYKMELNVSELASHADPEEMIGHTTLERSTASLTI